MVCSGKPGKLLGLAFASFSIMWIYFFFSSSNCFLPAFKQVQPPELRAGALRGGTEVLCFGLGPSFKMQSKCGACGAQCQHRDVLNLFV